MRAFYVLSLFVICGHAHSICENPVINYDPPYCPIGYEHVKTGICACVDYGCCEFICEAECVEIDPVPISCEDPLCVGVPYLLDDNCPVGQEVIGESCSCSLFDNQCSKSCDAICGYPVPDPVDEPVLIAEPEAQVGEPEVPIEGRLGSFDVIQGEFIYTIPLLGGAKGTNGMEPGLSLSYGSNAGHDVLGLGWQLAGGLSMIHRCGQTQVLDGQIRGIDFSEQDRFCLDGRRLLLVSGSYGADGSWYRFEHDDMTKVKSLGSLGSGPLSFEVWYPNGTRVYYGVSENSRLVVEKEGVEVVRLWGRDRVEDHHGNWMSYRYLENDYINGVLTDLTLSGIDYTGHGETDDPYASVEFDYELRPDQRVLYQSGVKIRKLWRLESIRMLEGAAVIHSYHLDYDGVAEADKRASQLISIYQCYKETYCSNKTRFNWSNADFDGRTYSDEDTQDWIHSMDFYAEWNDSVASRLSRVMVGGDFDGDGDSDIYIKLANKKYDENYQVINQHDWIYLTVFNEENQSYEYRKIKSIDLDHRPMTIHDSNPYSGRMKFADFDGDGDSDLYLLRGGAAEEDADQWDVFKNEQDIIFMFDIPKDGLDEEGNPIEYADYEVLYGVNSGVISGDDQQALYDYDRFSFADFNGDGYLDVHINLGTPLDFSPDLICYFVPGVGHMEEGQTGLEALEAGNCSYGEVQTASGDATVLIEKGYYDARVNVMGKVIDVVMRVGMTAGGVLAPPLSPVISIFQQHYQAAAGRPRTKPTVSGRGNMTLLGDFNGDGLADIYAARPIDVDEPNRLYFSTGDSFEMVEVVGLDVAPHDPQYMVRYQTGDFNGDGLTDIIRLTGAAAVHETIIFPDYPEKLYLSKGDGSFELHEDETMPAYLNAHNGYFPGQNPDAGYPMKRWWHQINRYRFLDFDNDGLVDMQALQSCDVDSEAEVLAGIDKIYHGTGVRGQYRLVEQGYGTELDHDVIEDSLLDQSRTFYGDFNGDGYIDLYVNRSDTSLGPADQIIYNRNKPIKIESIVHDQGFGGAVEVSYSMLKDSSVYESAMGALEEVDLSTDRYVPVMSAMSVVSEVRGDVAPDSEQVLRYFYRGGRLDKERGFLGFREISVESSNSALDMDLMRQTNQYHQQYPFTGLIEYSKSERLVNEYNTEEEVLLSEVNNLWVELPDIDLGNRHVVVLKQSDGVNYHADDGVALSRQRYETTDWYVDANHEYWFTGSTKQQIYTGDGSELLHQSITAYDYKNIPLSWQIGLVKEVERWMDDDEIKDQSDQEETGKDEKWSRVYMEYDADHRLHVLKGYYKTKDDNNQEIEVNYLVENHNWDTYGNLTRYNRYGDGISYADRFEIDIDYDANGRYGAKVRNVYDHEREIEYRDAMFGVPLQVIDASGHKRAVKLDSRGVVIKSWDEQGHWLTLDNDWCEGSCAYGSEFVKRTQVSSSADRIDESYYDGWGRLLGSKRFSPDSGEVYTRIQYDALGRVKRVWGPKVGQPIEVSDAVDVDSQGRYYDDLNRIRQIDRYGKSSGLNHQYSHGTEWDAALDQLLSFIDIKEGFFTLKKRVYHNALGQVVKVIDYNGIDEIVLRYEYDVLGNMTKLWPEGYAEDYIRTWVYDGLSRKVSQSDSSMGTWSYEYDGVGQVISQIDGKGQERTIGYDRLGRIDYQSDADGYTDFHYDTKYPGSLDWVSKDYSVYSEIKTYKQEYNYDVWNRLMSKVTTLDGVPYVMGFGYDEHGRQDFMGYPDGDMFNNKFAIEYVYGDLGQIREVKRRVNNGDKEVSYWQLDELDEYHRITKERLGDINEGDYVYRHYDYHDGVKGNRVSRIESWMGAQQTIIQSMNFDYDMWGRVLEYRDDEIMGVSESYEYDELDRLKAVYSSNPLNNASYAYDDMGNMTLKDHVGGPGVLGYDPDRPYLLTDTVNTSLQFSYDANGNMLTKSIPDSVEPLREISWTVDNRPRMITNRQLEKTDRMYFVYDPFGALIYKRYEDSEGNVKTHVMLDSYQLIESNEVEWQQVYQIPGGVQLTVSSDATERLEVLLKDHLGSVVGIQGFDGQMDYSGFNYGAYGELRQSGWGWQVDWFGNSDQTSYGYTGHLSVYGDQEQLVSMGARMYDPDIGRFISSDSITYGAFSSQALNQYGYVHGNPLTMIDPTGQCPFEWCGALGFLKDLAVTQGVGQGTQVAGNGIFRLALNAGMNAGLGMLNTNLHTINVSPANIFSISTNSQAHNQKDQSVTGGAERGPDRSFVVEIDPKTASKFQQSEPTDSVAHDTINSDPNDSIDRTDDDSVAKKNKENLESLAPEKIRKIGNEFSKEVQRMYESPEREYPGISYEEWMKRRSYEPQPEQTVESVLKEFKIKLMLGDFEKEMLRLQMVPADNTNVAKPPLPIIFGIFYY